MTVVGRRGGLRRCGWGRRAGVGGVGSDQRRDDRAEVDGLHAQAGVHRIQAAGIEVMAGMIVGFDNDDPSIFEEQFAFIQQARIPISMTGMLNAVPKTPLHARLKAAGRLIAESVGDQFVFTNIVPSGMTRLELYEGYQALLHRLYDYANYRRRAMAFILNRGELIVPAGRRRDDLAGSRASCGRDPGGISAAAG